MTWIDTARLPRAGPLLLLFLFLASVAPSRPVQAELDARRHLATKTSYAQRQHFPGAPYLNSTTDPPGYRPLHLWLLSRHGTRYPNLLRMTQIRRLEAVFPLANNTARHPWMQHWRSPYSEHSMHMTSGELHAIGEMELWSLGQRLAARFPSVVSPRYLPRRFHMASSQESRAAASASAFAAGFFPQPQTPHPQPQTTPSDPDPAAAPPSAHRPRSRALRAAAAAPSAQAAVRPQPVAITMAPKHDDPLLRFFDTCPRYYRHLQATKTQLALWEEPYLEGLVPGLSRRLGLSRPLQPKEVAALWQLCVVEAGLQGDVSKACSLFTADDVQLVEWLEDVGLWEVLGYGASINYRIAAVLMSHLHGTLKDISQQPDPFLRTSLLFAHAETLVPMAALLGLFNQPQAQAQAQAQQTSTDLTAGSADGPPADSSLLPRNVLERGRREARLGGLHALSRPQAAGRSPIPGAAAHKRLPPVPRSGSRTWRGARIAPYGGNMLLVLYRAEVQDDSRPQHLVRLIYNEQWIPLPACAPSTPAPPAAGAAPQLPLAPPLGLDCPLDDFLAAYHDVADPNIMEQECQL